MTAAREAIYLPVLCLTVVLLGSLRMDGANVLPPPSPFSLVLGILLFGVLVQSGALAPERVMSASRSTLQNLNGFVLLATLVFACGQMFSLLTPAAGLPKIVFSAYFLVLMLNTFAAGPDRVRLLRSLAVTFGAAFILNFVVLNALSNPAGGRLTRVLQLLLEGVTLGALTQGVQSPATSYIALFTIVVFLVTLSMLPGRLSRSVRDAIEAGDDSTHNPHALSRHDLT